MLSVNPGCDRIEQISISLDEAVIEQLKSASEAMQLSVSATARLALMSGLRRIDGRKVDGFFKDGVSE